MPEAFDSNKWEDSYQKRERLAIELIELQRDYDRILKNTKADLTQLRELILQEVQIREEIDNLDKELEKLNEEKKKLRELYTNLSTQDKSDEPNEELDKAEEAEIANWNEISELNIKIVDCYDRIEKNFTDINALVGNMKGDKTVLSAKNSRIREIIERIKELDKDFPQE